MRRLPSFKLLLYRILGITSAGAETTVEAIFGRLVLGDHLRGCGDYQHGDVMLTDEQGSPPRVRRLPQTLLLMLGYNGITSAGAETT